MDWVTNLEWLIKIFDPDHLPSFTDYGLKVMTLRLYQRNKKRMYYFNHCFRLLHGRRREYIWIYWQQQTSYVPAHGALMCSITVIIDVTHLHGADNCSFW